MIYTFDTYMNIPLVNVIISGKWSDVNDDDDFFLP